MAAEWCSPSRQIYIGYVTTRQLSSVVCHQPQPTISLQRYCSSPTAFSAVHHLHSPVYIDVDRFVISALRRVTVHIIVSIRISDSGSTVGSLTACAFLETWTYRRAVVPVLAVASTSCQSSPFISWRIHFRFGLVDTIIASWRDPGNSRHWATEAWGTEYLGGSRNQSASHAIIGSQQIPGFPYASCTMSMSAIRVDDYLHHEVTRTRYTFSAPARLRDTVVYDVQSYSQHVAM